MQTHRKEHSGKAPLQRMGGMVCKRRNPGKNKTNCKSAEKNVQLKCCKKHQKVARAG